MKVLECQTGPVASPVRVIVVIVTGKTKSFGFRLEFDNKQGVSAGGGALCPAIANSHKNC